jgi:glycosyltransferase involved in cell wall biosynthesis
LFNPDPFSFNVLRFLRRPVVYTVVAGVHSVKQAEAQQLARQVHTLVVPTEAALARLQGWGIRNVVVVRPGIDASRLSYKPPLSDSPPTLLMASAPWTRDQFATKGIDTLLELARRMPELKLVFLWRGMLVEEMNSRVRSAGLDQRVEVLNERVDVDAVLARVHAAVVMTADGALVKAYPHSLMEALAAGRPVLVSRSIPMAQYVEQMGCGVVVERLDLSSVRNALEALMEDYQTFQQRALSVGVGGFTLERLLTAYGRIYEGVQR